MQLAGATIDGKESVSETLIGKSSKSLIVKPTSASKRVVVVANAGGLADDISIDLAPRQVLRAPPTLPDFAGFIEASRRGDVNALGEYLRAGIDVNAKDEAGRTALTYAASRDEQETVSFLLTKGADANSRDSQGYTALMHATQAGKKGSVVRLMKADGARFDMVIAEKRFTPLHLVASQGWDDVINFIAIRPEVEINSRDYAGRTPLMLAARQGYFSTVIVLHALNADLTNQDLRGYNAYSHADCRRDDTGKNIIDWLVKHDVKRIDCKPEDFDR